ncbi:GNAT family N-acetyltransferase [Pseudolysinimonas sp.]|uniref:GNAT family N-acetyltransferase n=1 Tax=Pseudolysinimonas sp. TaxID=2680009 RepID=UPI00286C2EF8|nr:GNAT family N-acetyltransferase [Pseudolysinimonas sp.]
MTEHVLDRPVWHSLIGVHTHLARRHGTAAAFDPAVSPFAGTGTDGDAAWADLRAVLGAGGTAFLPGSPFPVPDDVRVPFRVRVLQMVAADWRPESDPDAIELGPDDADEMHDLASRTKPGPFGLRTRELGRFVGYRVDGKLVAMAGERFHPPGYTEVSAVCTDPEFRGRGYAERAMRTVGASIVARGEIPFLHVATDNPAISIYERLGFVTRLEYEVAAVVIPGVASNPVPELTHPYAD